MKATVNFEKWTKYVNIANCLQTDGTFLYISEILL